MLVLRFKYAGFREGENITFRRAGKYEDLVAVGDVVKLSDLEGGNVHEGIVSATYNFKSVDEIDDGILEMSHDERIVEGGPEALIAILDDVYGGFDAEDPIFAIAIDKVEPVA